jgi:CubicO group peptidase (beta-lactamase class C family)
LKKNLYCLLFIFVSACQLSGSGKTERKHLVFLSPSPGGSLTDEELNFYFPLVKNHFDSLLGKNFNGQLLIAKNGTVIYEKIQGLTDLRTGDSMTAESPLHIASTSKTFTAMAVLKLIEEEKLLLDDTLGKFFTGLPYYGISIKMLLSHRSGLPNYLHFLSQLKRYDTCYSNYDVLNALYSMQPSLEFRPGTHFSYSNTNYVLLALIIEKITGESYPVYMKQQFFDPLGMTHTFVNNNTDPGKSTPSFDGYGRYWKPDEFDCTYGDKNIFSTARDLLMWDQALYSDQLLKKETLDSAFTPLSNERRSIHNYGLGWRMMIFPTGKKIIYHNGRWHGSNAVLARLTDERATIIIIGNKFNRNIYHAGYTGYNLFGNYLPGYNQPDDDDENADTIATDKKNQPVVKTRKNGSKKTKR